MKKIFTLIFIINTAVLMAQSVVMDIHQSNGQVTRIPTSNIDSITYTYFPIVNTLPIIVDSLNTNPMSIISGGEIISDGGYPIIEKGIVWTYSLVFMEEVTLENNDGFTIEGSGASSFSSLLSGLNLGRIYVRAYATNSIGNTAYGNVVSSSLCLSCGRFNGAFNGTIRIERPYPSDSVNTVIVNKPLRTRVDFSNPMAPSDELKFDILIEDIPSFWYLDGTLHTSYGDLELIVDPVSFDILNNTFNSNNASITMSNSFVDIPNLISVFSLSGSYNPHNNELTITELILNDSDSGGNINHVDINLTFEGIRE